MINKLKGSRNIFKFTLTQGLKTKSMKMTTAILCLIFLVSVPVISIFSKDDSGEKIHIKKVYVIDMTGLNMTDNLSKIKDKSGKFDNIEYLESKINTEDIQKAKDPEKVFKFEKKSEYIYLVAAKSDKEFNFQIFYDKKTKVDKNDVQGYQGFLDENFKSVIADGMKLSADKRDVISADAKIHINEKKDAKTTKKDVNAEGKYNIIYFSLMIFLFILAYGGERIASGIIVEKSSKIMDMLLVSVEPMAIVTGKVVANLLILFIQVLGMALSFGVSLVINGLIFNDGNIYMPKLLKSVFDAENFKGANALNIVVSLLIFVAGFFVYGLIAGVAGASVSKIEDMAEGVKVYSVLLVICAYFVMYIVIGRNYVSGNVVAMVAEILPITALFITPAAMITGYVSLSTGLISLGILVVSIYILMNFVANIYESMVYYNGKPLKIKEIINISKMKKSNKKRGEK